MSLALVNRKAALLAPWNKNELWRRARAVPSLDLRFADNKSLVDATTGQNLVSFTRASSGTYVDSQGVIRTATTNLQTWSEDFRNTADAGATRPWSYNTSSVTADNTTAPNGTTTADLIAGVAGTANKFLSSNIPTTAQGVYTFSVYLKQGTEQFVVVRLSDGSANGIRGRFDLAAGTVVVTNEGTATGQAASATAVGNGWYRCVVTCSVSSLPNSVMQPQLWLNNFASTSLTTNYFAWGAQLEQSSTVGEYIPTTSTINSAPRFDHNPTTGESLGLLVEESRTNLLQRSEEFDNAYWTKGGSTISANSATAPDGLTTADKLVEDTSTGNHRLFVATTSLAANTAHSLSVYVKAAGRTFIRVEARDSVGAFAAQDFNLTTLAITTAGSGTGAISSLGNGWYRCTVTGTSSASGGLGTVLFWALSAAGGTSYTGDGTSGLLLWGAQLEAGAFPTSYIPTTTATATRSADVASISGSNFSSWYRQDEGAVFAEALAPSVNTTIAGFSDGTTNERILMDAGTNTKRLTVTDNGVLQASVTRTYVYGAMTKSAAGLKLDSCQFADSGSLGVEDTAVTLPTVDRLNIGANATGALPLNGTIRRLTYWPQRLSNPILSSITQ